MPPKKSFFKYSEEDLLKCLEEINGGAKIRPTCRKYYIPHSTVINKLKMRHPVPRKMGPPTILTPQEELLLTRWINANAKKGIPITKERLLETVSQIIQEDGRKNPFNSGVPGRKWFNSFLRRHPDIAQRHAESINSARSRVTEESLRKWHSDLKEFLTTENAEDILNDPDRIINADESGFNVCPSSGLVLGPKGMANLYEIRDKEKESITVLGTFSAAGKVLPTLIIYPYERIPFEIARNIPEDWASGKSPKGWMTSRVFYGYIANTLLPAIRKSNVEFPILFLIDGHKSHITYEVSQLCNDNQIILYALHPNATHIIQPADVSVFKPLKNSWKKVVNKWKSDTGNRVVTRAQFAPLLRIAMKAATPEIISNGFRKCGLYPFNVDAIDFTKCMSNESRHSVIDKPAEISVEHALYFESLMSQRRIPEFRAVDPNEPWTGEESAKELFYVWRKIRKNVQNIEHDEEHESIPENDADNEISPEIEIPDSPMSPRDQQTPSPISPNLLEGTSFIEFGPGPSNQQTAEEQATSHNNLEATPPKAKGSPKQQDPKPGPSKMPISPAFSNAILWPTESPIKNTGRKKSSKQRLPDAIGSAQWVMYWNEKKKEKEDKEKKSLARAEKKMLKDAEKNDQPKRKRKKKVFVESDSDDDDIPLNSLPQKPTNLEDTLEMGSYVIVKYEGEYFPGQIKNIDGCNAEVSTMVLSSATTFKWPEKEDTIWYGPDSIIEVIKTPVPLNTRGSYKVEEMAKFLQWI